MAAELVLIVEDNVKNMKLARDVLQYNGFRTLEAVNGTDGVRMAGEHHPDIVLMDIQLPDMDGQDALAFLRADPATAAVTVVAMTAFAMREERDRLLGAGFDGYLSKPIDIKAFPGQVRAFCESACAGRGSTL